MSPLVSAAETDPETGLAVRLGHITGRAVLGQHNPLPRTSRGRSSAHDEIRVPHPSPYNDSEGSTRCLRDVRPFFRPHPAPPPRRVRTVGRPGPTDAYLAIIWSCYGYVWRRL